MQVTTSVCSHVENVRAARRLMMGINSSYQFSSLSIKTIKIANDKNPEESKTIE